MNTDTLPGRSRAWDLINKEMHYNFQCIFVKSGDEDQLPSGIIFSSDLFTPSFEKWPPEEKVNRKFALMEWIHAVDEMNMPIYECDLLSVKDEKEEFIGIAYWAEKGRALCWNIDKVKDGKLSEYVFFSKPNTKFTIVGNVYENSDIVSELLKDGVIKIIEE